MKRLLICCLIVVSIILVGCSSNQSELTRYDGELDTFLVRESIYLTNEMYDLASNQEYVDIMTGSPEIEDVFNQITTFDYSNPEKVFVYTLTEERFLKLLNYLDDVSMSDNLKEKLMKKVNSASLITVMNANAGAVNVAATSMLSSARSYIQPEDFTNNVLVVLKYSGDYSVAISFHKTGDNVITGLAYFVYQGDDDFNSMLNEQYDLTDVLTSELSGGSLENMLE